MSPTRPGGGLHSSLITHRSSLSDDRPSRRLRSGPAPRAHSEALGLLLAASAAGGSHARRALLPGLFGGHADGWWQVAVLSGARPPRRDRDGHRVAADLADEGPGRRPPRVRRRRGADEQLPDFRGKPVDRAGDLRETAE